MEDTREIYLAIAEFKYDCHGEDAFEEETIKAFTSEEAAQKFVRECVEYKLKYKAALESFRNTEDWFEQAPKWIESCPAGGNYLFAYQYYYTPIDLVGEKQ